MITIYTLKFQILAVILQSDRFERDLSAATFRL